MRHTLNNYEVLTQSVHTPACYGGGHNHRQGIHLVERRY